MPKQKSNMFGGFDAAAAQREQEQERIEVILTDAPEVTIIPSGQKRRRRGEDSTTMTLAVSKEDKLLVKTFAAQHGTTVSELFHTWIAQHCAH